MGYPVDPIGRGGPGDPSEWAGPGAPSRHGKTGDDDEPDSADDWGSHKYGEGDVVIRSEEDV
jgi:hypothetical protein